MPMSIVTISFERPITCVSPTRCTSYFSNMQQDFCLLPSIRTGQMLIQSSLRSIVSLLQFRFCGFKYIHRKGPCLSGIRCRKLHSSPYGNSLSKINFLQKFIHRLFLQSLSHAPLPLTLTYYFQFGGGSCSSPKP